jgi:hypothetical protein
VDTIIVTYGGDANNVPNSTIYSISVGYGAFLSVTPGSVTIHAGQSSTLTLTVTPEGGGSGLASIALTCIPSVPGITCSLSTSDINVASNTQPQQVVVTINAASVASLHQSDRAKGGAPLLAGLFLPGILGLVAITRRRRLWFSRTIMSLVLVFSFLGVALCLTSCGSGSSTTSSTQPVTQTVKVIAILASYTTVATTTFSVTVQ